MNGAILRYEALRLLPRGRRWRTRTVILFLVYAPIMARLPARAIAYATVFGLVLGMAVAVGNQETDFPYLLSRAATRSELLVAQWAFGLIFGVVVWSWIALLIAWQGAFSPANVGTGLVMTFLSYLFGLTLIWPAKKTDPRTTRTTEMALWLAGWFPVIWFTAKAHADIQRIGRAAALGVALILVFGVIRAWLWQREDF